MGVTFTKLFSSITESTVWCEPPGTRLVWITMLAMSDRLGRVWASVPGLANRARVTLEEAEKALATFLSPDTYSRTPDHEGRRIEPIDGGWRLLNHAKYRAIRDDEARKAYKREWIKERRHNQSTVDRSRPPYTHAEADTDTEAKTERERGATRPRATRLAEDWHPSEELQAWARRARPDVDMTLEAETFRNYWTAKSGKDATKLKWDATFRNWILKSKPTAAVTGSAPSKTRTKLETLQRMKCDVSRSSDPEPIAAPGLLELGGDASR